MTILYPRLNAMPAVVTLSQRFGTIGPIQEYAATWTTMQAPGRLRGAGASG